MQLHQQSVLTQIGVFGANLSLVLISYTLFCEHNLLKLNPGVPEQIPPHLPQCLSPPPQLYKLASAPKAPWIIEKSLCWHFWALKNAAGA